MAIEIKTEQETTGGRNSQPGSSRKAELACFLEHVRRQPSDDAAKCAAIAWLTPSLKALRPGESWDLQMIVAAWVALLDEVTAWPTTTGSRNEDNQVRETLLGFANLAFFTLGVARALSEAQRSETVAWNIAEALFSHHMRGARATRAHIECVLLAMELCCPSVREYALAFAARNEDLRDELLAFRVWGPSDLVAAGCYLLAHKDGADASDLVTLTNFYATLLMHGENAGSQHVTDALREGLKLLLEDEDLHGAALALCCAMHVANINLRGLAGAVEPLKNDDGVVELCLNKVPLFDEGFLGLALLTAKTLGIVCRWKNSKPEPHPDVYLELCAEDVDENTIKSDQKVNVF